MGLRFLQNAASTAIDDEEEEEEKEEQVCDEEGEEVREKHRGRLLPYKHLRKSKWLSLPGNQYSVLIDAKKVSIK